MAYDENGQWIDEPDGQPEPGGIGGPIVDFFKGLFGPSGQPQQDQTPPPPPVSSASEPDPGSSSSDDQSAADYLRAKAAESEGTAAHTQALARAANANAAIAEAKLQAQSDPNSPESRAAKAELEKAELELEKLKSAMSPEAAARLQDQLAREREQIRQQFDADQLRSKQQFDSQENQAQRDFNAQQNDLSRGVTLRGQEIERLKSQDDWVLGLLRQQVAEGTLSLQRATNMFNAYVDRARLPSQIMESVSRAVEPFSASIPGNNYVAPGMEKGGPYEQLVAAGGGDTSTIQRNPFKDLKGVDMFKLAKKAGADFKNTKIPDPGEIFGSVPIPQTNMGDYQSALAGFPAAQFAGAAAPGGSPPPPAAGPVGSVTPAPDWQMDDDQIARLNALLDGAQ